MGEGGAHGLALGLGQHQWPSARAPRAFGQGGLPVETAGEEEGGIFGFEAFGPLGHLLDFVGALGELAELLFQRIGGAVIGAAGEDGVVNGTGNACKTFNDLQVVHATSCAPQKVSKHRAGSTVAMRYSSAISLRRFCVWSM